MVNLNDIQVALKCTAENLFIILPVLLLSGAAACFVGWTVRGRVKKAKAALVPLIIAEFVLCLAMLPYLTRWVAVESFSDDRSLVDGWIGKLLVESTLFRYFRLGNMALDYGERTFRLYAGLGSLCFV